MTRRRMLALILAGLLSIVVLVSLWSRDRDRVEYEIRGRVVCDGCKTARCIVDFNSRTAPFYAPYRLATGLDEEFKYVLWLDPIHEMKVGVRCSNGYQLPEERAFGLRGMWIGRVTIDLGELKVVSPDP